jgi:hypothetical protein
MVGKKPQEPTRKQLKAEAAMGKPKFVLMRGVIGWGLPTLGVYLMISFLLHMGIYKKSVEEVIAEMFPVMFIIAAVIFAIAGIFMGQYRWKQLQLKLNKKERSKDGKGS